MDGWIKLHRRMTDWEWYDDINVKVLFLHLLLTVNNDDKKWHGVDVPAGSIITSREKLAKQTMLSVQQVRTSLKKLTSTNELTIQSTNRFMLISIVKWGVYQDRYFDDNQRINRQMNRQATNNQPTINQQSTTTKEHKEEEEYKEIKKKEVYTAPNKPQKHKYGEYLNVLLSDDELEKLKQKHPVDWSKKIEALSRGIEMKGYKYKNHYLAILKWAERDEEERKEERRDDKPRRTMYFPDVR